MHHEKRRRYLQLVIGVIVATMSVLHLCTLWLYDAPDNFFTIYYGAGINAYVNTLFSQNWRFFAPTPIDKDMHVMVRGQTCARKVTPWIDMSAPLIKAIQRNRFSSYEAVLTGLSNSMFSAARTVNFSDAIKSKQNLYDKTGYHEMYRTGTSVLLSILHEKPCTVQVAVFSQVFPRFTHRMEPMTSGGVFLTFPWITAPKNVYPFPM
ncbi:MAG TPA: DUF5819 family protein [Candidatus Baltobacteraceae bacterium]|nr:DUF5819 family protein [Candidatus Baltobacteraceae bacterium]